MLLHSSVFMVLQHCIYWPAHPAAIFEGIMAGAIFSYNISGELCPGGFSPEDYVLEILSRGNVPDLSSHMGVKFISWPCNMVRIVQRRYE